VRRRKIEEKGKEKRRERKERMNLRIWWKLTGLDFPLLSESVRKWVFRWREGMIVNDGKLQLLTSEYTYLSGLVWGLFTNNATIAPTTTFSALTEAGWAGYARVPVGTLQAAAISSNKAVTQPNVQPTFGNSSGSTQTFFGWFLYDPVAGKLIAAANIGSTSLASGASFPLATVLTDDTA
jgi:hypothetical protein